MSNLYRVARVALFTCAMPFLPTVSSALADTETAPPGGAFTLMTEGMGPSTGACCLPDGCAELTADECEGGAGLYQGDGTMCALTECPLPDLVVTDVDASGVVTDCQTLEATGIVSAIVENVGTADTIDNTTVVFFEDRDGDGELDPDVDLVLGTEVVAPLPDGETMPVAVPVDAMVTFAGNLIYAVVDPDDAIAESDEENNVSNSGAGCAVEPTPGVFDPELEWSWTSSAVMPSSLNVMMTPSVIDVNGDDVPDVVFASTSSTGGALVEIGVLRALDGASGTELFTVTDAALRVNTASSIATGDIDGDGRPEIVACDSSGFRIIVFEHDGTFKRRSPNLEAINWGASAIADLDADGTPEIIVGRQVLESADGTVRWTGTGGRGTQGAGPISCVADIDLDGAPDIVAGNTVYRADGSILWQASVPDGTTAVADFDDDGFAEIVLVTGGRVRLLDQDGSVLWNVVIPGGGSGGPPTIANYDDDSDDIEIGVAAASRYTVFKDDGSVLWSSPTQDGSSNVTGSSVFDFDGDNSAEVVYRDELRLRVYRGTDGTVLFQTPMSSCTWHEYVLVADVDADGNAEIVAVANNNCGFGPQRGVFVFGDASDAWVSTREIWNQHTYHVTNVDEDGSIPAVEQNNWEIFNNYRKNEETEGPGVFAAPDLTVSLLQASLDDCPENALVTARIGNGGANVAGAGIDIAVYEGDPAGGVLLGVAQTSGSLDPGEFEDVTLAIPPLASSDPTLICVVADDDGTGTGSESECNEDNNLCCAELVLACGGGACCFADGGCALREQDECVEAGGSYQGDGTACALAECPLPDGACCLESGLCGVVSAITCADLGGAYQGDGLACLDVDCLQPPAACCFDGGSCLMLTQDACGDDGGSYQGAGTTCGDVICPGPSGACCLFGGSCFYTTAMTCADAGGVYQGDESTCGTVDCPEPTGACCFASGACMVRTLSSCIVEGGVYQGDGVPCDPSLCPQPPGACCLDDGTCVVVMETSCEGEFRGQGTTCEDAPCLGACCFDDGECMDLTLESCLAGGGTYRGFGTECDPTRCPGACCFDDGTCEVRSLEACVDAEGDYKGFEVECTDDLCPGPGACCLPVNDDDFDCDGKIVQMTMIWDGDEPVRIRAYDGAVGSQLLADIDDIQVGDEVTIGPLDGPNDSYWEIFEAGTSNLIGLSKFHRSCSDHNMNGPEDCGKRQGNGKSDDDDLINEWLLEGLVDESGAVLDCNSLGGDDGCIEVDKDDCEAAGGVFQGIGTSCEDVTCVTLPPFECDGKIVELTMIWDGDEAVRIRAYDGDVGSQLLADIDDIQIGDEITVGPLDGPNDSYWQIFEAGTSNHIGLSKFHRSCSDSDMNGPEDCGKRQGNGKSNDDDLINDWILEGLVDEAGGVLDCSSLAAPLTGGVDGPVVTPAADVDGDGTVGFQDLLDVLSDWGTCRVCSSDVNADGRIDIEDLMLVVHHID